MINYPDRFRQAKPAGFDGVFEWDFLRGAFGNTIMPMDFDGVVERRGHFLVFETKAEGTPIPVGQKITLEALCKTNIFTVFILYGKTADTISSLDVWHKNNRHQVNPADSLTVYDRAAAWYEYATKDPYPIARQDIRQLITDLEAENNDLRLRLENAITKIKAMSNQLEYMRQHFKPQPVKNRSRHAELQERLFEL